ncbi:MAG: CotH kinase family protein [Bacteroidetes bacterium]|nr:CotH kinase family protein [Bacteroidota bacterium]MBP7398464.1 CotH kinase family protein [Chitinophagales bacterium]MBK7108471.1 CotH kinase family protein [Bacteroidota bacterium]MBK8489207.1 CotH kinase family protein [Bacteroidota bacterium]MBK8681058.1 CotH kinase family protein [Bacteroidota bacterium]
MKKYLLLPVISILIIFQSLNAQVVINEFSAANFSDVADNHSEYEDWIELYNAGATSVDLAGYYLSDRVDEPTKWIIPSGITIDAGAFKRFWCSGRNVIEGTNYHTNFKITQTRDVEAVVFSDASGTVLDYNEIEQPNQMNHSWGRSTDGSANWKIFIDPTPNASNTTTSKTAYATKPDMEPNSGNYAGSVSVTITSPDADVTIRYTTNGSAPTAASTLYSSAINITETSVLRTIAFSTDGEILPSFISSNTYFIDEVTTIPILSIASENVDDLLNGNGWLEPIGSFELFNAAFELEDEAQGTFNEHGNDSWAYDQRGFDYVTRDQFGYDDDIDLDFFSDVTDRTGYQRLIVKAAANDNYPYEDGAHLRDAYVHHLTELGHLELDERSTFFAIVFVNGEYWGVYDVREKVDDADFTDYYFDQDEYEMDFIKCWGWTWAEYGTMDEWPPFVDFVLTNDMTDPLNYAYVDDNLNTLSLCDYFITNTQTVCKDWLNWNTGWWRGYDPDGGALKWRYILWDEDATFGHYVNYTGIPDDSPEADPCDPLDISADGNGHVDIINALLENETFFSLYVNRFADLNATTFSCDFMLSVLDSMKNVIDPEMERQTDRWGGSYSGWSSNYDELYEFIEDRCAYMLEGIEDCFDTPAYPVTLKIEPVGSANLIKVNTLTPTAYPFNATYYGGVTFSLNALPATGYLFDHWEFLHHTPTPSDIDPAVTLSLTSSDTIIAYFTTAELPSYNFSLDIDPIGSGNVAVNTLTPGSYPYAATYLSGTIMNMDAVASPGYVFDYWELDNHIVNPDPFTADVYFAMSTFDNVIAHFSDGTPILDSENDFSFNITPNVTSATIQINISLANAADVQAELFSVSGNRIAELIPASQIAIGTFQSSFDISTYGISSGIYFVRLIANGNTFIEKIIFNAD